MLSAWRILLRVRFISSFLTKKHKPALAVVNVEIALVDMKTAKVEVEAQIQI